MGRFLFKFFLLIAFPVLAAGQDYLRGPDYRIMLLNNPSLAGSEGTGVIRTAYQNIYPGNSYNLHSVFVSYDSYIEDLHGGIAFIITDEYMGGIINDLKGSFSYSYNLQAGKDLFINAGLSASFLHRGYNFSGAILPDQIDPLGGVSLPSSEILASDGSTLFDLGTGFLLYGKSFLAGVSVSHLTEPYLSFSDSENNHIYRKYLVHGAGDISLRKTENLHLRPFGNISLQGEWFDTSAGMAVETKVFSLSAAILGSSNKCIDAQTGFYLETGSLGVFYNYRFNLISGNTTVPISLMHQVGIAFSLQNVNKRNGFNAINFPKL